jgi:hypothetical protein
MFCNSDLQQIVLNCSALHIVLQFISFSIGLLCLTFCNYFLPQQVCSASRSLIIFFLNRSALHHVLLLFCSSSTLPVICSVSNKHFISFCTLIKLVPQPLLLLPFSLFHSFFPTEQCQHIQCHSFSFIHLALMIPLPIYFGKNNENCLSN